MKNTKLEIIRFNNKDVLATSLICDGKKHFVFTESGESEEIPYYAFDVYKYNAASGKYEYECGISIDYPEQYFDGVTPVDNDVFVGTDNGHFIKIECEHNLLS